MSRLEQLGKDSFVYGIGGFAAKGLAFLLLPIYTRIFSTGEYGSIEMLLVLGNLVGAIVTTGTDSAQSLFFFKEKHKGARAQMLVVTAILQWKILWGSVVVIVATLTAPLLNSFLFKGRLEWEHFAVAFVGALLVQIMTQSAEVCRLLYRPWAYIGIILSQSGLAAGLVLLLVLYFEKGVLGFLLGTALASGTAALLGWYKIRRYVSMSYWQGDWWPRLLRFGVPLVPAGVAMYFMSTADRWFIQHYHGEEAVGLFAVGAKFSLFVALAVQVFRQAWWPIAMDSIYEVDGPQTFRTIARLFLGLGVASIVALTALSPWLVHWVTGPEFHDAWRIIGILSWQALFYGLYLVVSVGIWKTEKTHLNLYLMSGSALIGLSLNWWLVPTWGGVGAALATAVTYLLWVIASMIVSERLWKIDFDWLLMALQVGTGAAFVGWFLFYYDDTPASVKLSAVLLLLSGLIFSALKRRDWRAVMSYFRLT